MSSLKNKKVLLGVTGGIAAYKTAFLVRLLVKEGAEVKVILTKSALQFVTAQTLSVLSKNTVFLDFFDENLTWNNHVELAQWADFMLIAPLTANTLAKMAHGEADNLLMATYLSAKSKTFVAPAMDLDMFKHATVKKNLKTIAGYGNSIIPPESGELASGLHGEGRMAEPENILRYLSTHFSEKLKLKGKTALVNGGPTHEAIDPVRYIGNSSSGKMGIAIAESLADQGAEVTLVLGPTSLKPTNPCINVIHVVSSDDMYKRMLANYTRKDIVVCSAAVADYKPAKYSTSKLKKQDNDLRMNLVKTVDVLYELGTRKKEQFLVGFALETDNLVAHAKAKLQKKNLDLVVLNSASQKEGGIGSDTNQVTLINKHNKITKLKLKSKRELAEDIVAYIISILSIQKQKKKK